MGNAPVSNVCVLLIILTSLEDGIISPDLCDISQTAASPLSAGALTLAGPGSGTSSGTRVRSGVRLGYDGGIAPS